jgi:hypothetical protein
VRDRPRADLLRARASGVAHALVVRRAVITAVLVALLVAAAAGATRVRWHGGLASYGNAVGVPMRVGAPFSVGMAELNAGGQVRIESVRLDHPTPGIVLVGALVHVIGHGMVGAERAFPPTFPRVQMRPAVGAVLRAHARTVLVVGLRATRPGPFRVHGVDVLYREQWHGIELRRLAHVGVEVDVCALRTSARVPACTLPHPVDY